MEATFITIHDLTRDAHILYSSDSIVDILGHTPDEVVGRSCWDFFHPEEVPLARKMHTRGVSLDKAAVLAYCRIRNRSGVWVGCECCFSVVYDVMVCCTSIYGRGMTSQRRAAEAPIVRRLFDSSPKDPRYHMLTHLSAKFKQGPSDQSHEPRAALFLNRFTRTLTIMYATSGIEQIIGVSGEDMKGRSFYYCIQESCLEDAVRCLESAKGNDSIAYLRFWFRDPREEDEQDVNSSSAESGAEDTDEIMTDITTSEDENDGHVHQEETSGSSGLGDSRDTSNTGNTTGSHSAPFSGPSASTSGNGNTSTSTSTGSMHAALLGVDSPPASSIGSPSTTTSRGIGRRIELEAVVSCTSDGLVVCLRRAHPVLPPSAQPTARPEPNPYSNGMFAAPWAPEPVFVPALQPVIPPSPNYPVGYYGTGWDTPANSSYGSTRHQSSFEPYRPGPAQRDLMQSIRDVAVFAWALAGINGSLAEYARGKPVGHSQPPDGFPVWNPDPSLELGGLGGAGLGTNMGEGLGAEAGLAKPLPPLPPLDGVASGGSGYSSAKEPFGDPGLPSGSSSRSRSDGHGGDRSSRSES